MGIYTVQDYLKKTSIYGKPSVSTEGDINGKLNTELEFTMYAKLRDLNELERAIRKEEHEQWQLPIKTDKVDGRARLRLIDNRRYTMTTKIQRQGTLGWEEVDADISSDMFNHLREMATNGYRKTRYVFPTQTPGMFWEVDVFRDQMGNKHPWVKIDLEVDDLNAAIPNFPLAHDTMIQADDEHLTRQDQNTIKNLWSNEWLRIDAPLDRAMGVESTEDKKTSYLE